MNNKNIYSSRLIKIPTPQYYIFYNGKQKLADRTVLRLSDAFKVPPRDGEFEWTATMVNINSGNSQELMAHCQVLQEYSLFVDMVRQEAKETNDIAAAVTKAVDACIEQGILKDYLLARKSEVIDMVLTEYGEKNIGSYRQRRVRRRSRRRPCGRSFRDADQLGPQRSFVCCRCGKRAFNFREKIYVNVVTRKGGFFRLFFMPYACIVYCIL